MLICVVPCYVALYSLIAPVPSLIEFDVNGDGSISASELDMALRRLGISNLTPGNVQQSQNKGNMPSTSGIVQHTAGGRCGVTLADFWLNLLHRYEPVSVFQLIRGRR